MRRLPLLEIQLDQVAWRASQQPGADIAPEVLLLLAGAASAAAAGLAAWLVSAHARTKASAPSPELEAPAPLVPRVYSRWQLVALTSPTCAYACTATTLAFMLLPDEARLFPYEASWTLGLLFVVGSMAELPGPLLGHISDSLATPFGRRRPLMLLAAVVILGATAVQWLASMHLSLPLYACALLVHMLAWALLYAAQQGLVLDVLQTEQLNLASSCQAIFVALGACLAFGAAVALPSSLHYHYQYAVTALLTATTALFAVLVAHEEPSAGIEGAPGESDSLLGLFKRYYLLDFNRQYDFSLVMVGKAVMYGGGVAKGYLVYFLRDTWNVTDQRTLHRKVASIALSAEIVAGLTAGLLLVTGARVGPNRSASVGAAIIAGSWAVMIPLGFWERGYAFTELFALMYGVGHGLVLVGDQALTYHLIPEKAHGSRSFGMQSVAAFAGMAVAALCCSLLLDLFGRVLGPFLPGPRVGPVPKDGYRLEGYVAFEVFVLLANVGLTCLYCKIRQVGADAGEAEATGARARLCCGEEPEAETAATPSSAQA